MPEQASFKRSDVRRAIDALEDCAQILDEDYRDVEEFRIALATVKARLAASKEALAAAVDRDRDQLPVNLLLDRDGCSQPNRMREATGAAESKVRKFLLSINLRSPPWVTMRNPVRRVKRLLGMD